MWKQRRNNGSSRARIDGHFAYAPELDRTLDALNYRTNLHSFLLFQTGTECHDLETANELVGKWAEEVLQEIARSLPSRALMLRGELDKFFDDNFHDVIPSRREATAKSYSTRSPEIDSSQFLSLAFDEQLGLTSAVTFFQILKTDIDGLELYVYEPSGIKFHLWKMLELGRKYSWDVQNVAWEVADHDLMHELLHFLSATRIESGSGGSVRFKVGVSVNEIGVEDQQNRIRGKWVNEALAEYFLIEQLAKKPEGYLPQVFVFSALCELEPTLYPMGVRVAYNSRVSSDLTERYIDLVEEHLRSVFTSLYGSRAGEITQDLLELLEAPADLNFTQQHTHLPLIRFIDALSQSESGQRALRDADSMTDFMLGPVMYDGATNGFDRKVLANNLLGAHYAHSHATKKKHLRTAAGIATTASLLVIPTSQAPSPLECINPGVTNDSSVRLGNEIYAIDQPIRLPNGDVVKISRQSISSFQPFSMQRC
jgi:hypothetical protein